MCDTFVALGNSTADGRVLFAKNSDREPNEASELVIIPRSTHAAGETVRCTYTIIIGVVHNASFSACNGGRPQTCRNHINRGYRQLQYVDLWKSPYFTVSDTLIYVRNTEHILRTTTIEYEHKHRSFPYTERLLSVTSSPGTLLDNHMDIALQR